MELELKFPTSLSWERGIKGGEGKGRIFDLSIDFRPTLRRMKWMTLGIQVRDGLSCFSSFRLPPFPSTMLLSFSLFKIYLFIFSCAGPSLLRARLSLVTATGGSSFLWLTGCSPCGPSCCGAWALGTWASVAAVCGLSSCDAWA